MNIWPQVLCTFALIMYLIKLMDHMSGWLDKFITAREQH